MPVTRRQLGFGAAGLLAAPARAQSLRPVTVALASRSFGTAGVRMAKELGLFEQRGLDAGFVVLDSANAATTAIISGSLKFALSGPGELIAAQTRGQKVVAIANAAKGLTGSVVLAKPAAERAGVSPQDPIAKRLKALDGLTIASTAATSAYTVALRRTARDAGADIRFTFLAQPTMPAALESGAIQGFIAGAPFWAVPVVRKTGVLWLSGPGGDFPPQYTPVSSGTLQVMRDFAQRNAELVATFVAAVNDFSAFVRSRPADVKVSLMKLYPDLAPDVVDLLFPVESATWATDPLTRQDMVHEMALIQASGALAANFAELDPGSLLFP